MVREGDSVKFFELNLEAVAIEILNRNLIENLCAENVKLYTFAVLNFDSEYTFYKVI